MLDRIVHRDDLAIFPGNIGDMRVSFGLWKSHWGAALLEAALLVVGAFLYWRAATNVERAAGEVPRGANMAAGVILLGGLVVLLTDVFLA